MLVALLVTTGLFTWNGLVLAHGQTPIGSRSEGPAPASRSRIKVLAWNLAKCFVVGSGLSIAAKREVRTRLEAIAARIRAEQPDLVFLSEVVTEFTLCDIDQLASLREATGMPYCAFGENYNIGLPFFRVVGGNAILSRLPLKLIANPDLAGRKPFFISKNNRRFLLCETTVAGRPVLLGAMHTDSFDLSQNLRQTEQILGLVADHPSMLAGDFNADPDTASMRAVVSSQRFTGALEGDGTFPAVEPMRRIDYIFAPKTWRLIEHRVIDDRTSDHRPVVSEFEVAW